MSNIQGLLLIVGVVAAVGLVWRLSRRNANGGASSSASEAPVVSPLAPSATGAPLTTASAQPSASGPAAGPPPLTPTQWEMPADLVAFRRVEAYALDDEQLQALTQRMQAFPRPPRGLYELLSPSFMESATSEQLTELILTEPDVAAKVLASANASFYGSSRPVDSVDKAIAVLGLNTIRALCLQFMVNDALRPRDPRLQAIFERWWLASAIASQLCVRLGQRLNMPELGAMVTQLVLSFLGHMLALSLQPPEQTLDNVEQDFLERTRREQEQLGLCAGELGCLMLSEWAMPAPVVEDVRAIDRILTTPPKQHDEERGVKFALAYYCARLGEKLASSQWTDLEPADPAQLRGTEFFHLQTHFMIRPRLMALAQDFRDPAFKEEIARMVASVRAS